MNFLPKVIELVESQPVGTYYTSMVRNKESGTTTPGIVLVKAGPNKWVGVGPDRQNVMDRTLMNELSTEWFTIEVVSSFS